MELRLAGPGGPRRRRPFVGRVARSLDPVCLPVRQASRGVEPLTSSDFEVVLEAVCLVVDADGALPWDELALDCVEERGHCIGDEFVWIDVAGVRVSCDGLSVGVAVAAITGRHYRIEPVVTP